MRRYFASAISNTLLNCRISAVEITRTLAAAHRNAPCSIPPLLAEISFEISYPWAFESYYLGDRPSIHFPIAATTSLNRQYPGKFPSNYLSFSARFGVHSGWESIEIRLGVASEQGRFDPAQG